MTVSNFIIMPLFIAAFAVAYILYYSRRPKRLLLNPLFGLMIGAFILMIGSVATGGAYSWMFLALGLFWLGAALALRQARVRPHK